VGAWDCLLIDLHLGALSGLELAQHPAVKALKLPIIIMSGTSDEVLWDQAFALQCAGYLRKPFSVKELLEALTRAGL
jgi:FixJ family two-component response regulator